MCGKLLIEPHERVFLVLADQEADHDHRLSRARGGIQILDAGNFPEQLFDRAREPLLHLGGRSARHRDEHIDHRHDDLRLFLARQGQYGKKTKQHRRNHEQRRQLRVDERRRNPSGEPPLDDDHGRPPVTLTSLPSVSDAGGLTTTVSPGCTPASTSISSPARAPTVIARICAWRLESTTNTRESWPRRTIADSGMTRALRSPRSNLARANMP